MRRIKDNLKSTKMKVYFENKKLAQWATNEKKRQKELGTLRARLFAQRIDDLRAADSMDELVYYPGRYHPLREDRKGQWACDLDQPYRMVFSPVVQVKDGKEILKVEVKEVKIEEICNYHE